MNRPLYSDDTDLDTSFDKQRLLLHSNKLYHMSNKMLTLDVLVAMLMVRTNVDGKENKHWTTLTAMGFVDEMNTYWCCKKRKVTNPDNTNH